MRDARISARSTAVRSVVPSGPSPAPHDQASRWRVLTARKDPGKHETERNPLAATRVDSGKPASSVYKMAESGLIAWSQGPAAGGEGTGG